MLRAKFMTAGAALALSAVSPARGEPASADPAFLPETGLGEAATLSQFEVAGATFSIAARGRRASIDTDLDYDMMKESLALGKFVSGYPQPPLMTIDVRLWF